MVGWSDGLQLQTPSLSHRGRAIVHYPVWAKSQQTVLMMIHQVLSTPVFYTVSTRKIDSQTIYVRVVGSKDRSTNQDDIAGLNFRSPWGCVVVKFPSAVDLLFLRQLSPRWKNANTVILVKCFLTEFATVTFYDDQTSYIENISIDGVFVKRKYIIRYHEIVIRM